MFLGVARMERSEIRERRCGKKPALRFAPCGLRSLLLTDNSDGKTPIEPIDSAPAGVMVNKQDACGAIVRARGPSVSGRPRATHFAARFTTSKKTFGPQMCTVEKKCLLRSI